MKKIISLFAIMVFFALSSGAWAEFGAEEMFHDANKAYSEGNYDAAEVGYRKLLDEGIESAEIHNNLGEALMRQGKVGEAIFEFMVAEKLEPRNAEIGYNLQYARERITDKLGRPQVGVFLRPLDYIHKNLSERDALVVFVALSFLFWGFAILYLFVRKEALKWFVFVFGMLFVLQSFVLVRKEFLEKPFGVVTVSEAPVYSGPGEDNVLLFNLHEGTDFEAMPGGEKGWVQVKLADGKKGWIDRKNVIARSK